MRGTVLYGPRDIRFEDRETPKIEQPTDAVMRIAATCVCGSDLWPYRGLQPIKGPTPMGHEYCGIVEEVGSAVKSIKLGQFVIGAFRNALGPGEIVQAVRIPRPSAQARWGYYKACRKPGEFAHAMAAVLDDSTRGIRRAVIGAVGGPPVVLQGERVTPAAAEDALRDAGLDAIARRMQAGALKRALAEAAA